VSADGLLPAERKIVEELGHLPLDFRAMWAVSNVFRSGAALRRHLESTVLAADRLSLTPSGRKKIEALFPRFNAEEAQVVAALSEEQQERLASMLRTLLRGVEGGSGAAGS
jgi:hypothetical protein